MNGNDAISTGSGSLNNQAALTGRRDFFNQIATVALGVASLGAAVETVRFLAPKVLFEPPTSFRIGDPADYPVDSVTYLAEQQIYVLRTVGGIIAQSAICTHLGCITQWNTELHRISCPCHGSRFGQDGEILSGPATRPLPHFAVRLMPDGSLLVDKLDIVPQTTLLKV
ncbi:MAG: ubiquinol-cytochrome c reductase iron-sulfur subunit [Acidobacteriota bacterium]|jgi:cytochrome b6-f complex iron-sulfur subunit